jgi:exosortase K
MYLSSIIRKSPRALQSLILYGLTLLIALGLKYHYSRSGSEDLLWILTPTAGLVECISGTQFINEVNTGYVNYERRVIIAPSCAGINFMIIAFCMTAFSGLNTLTRVKIRLLWPMISLITAYGLTLGVNTFRIIISMVVYESEFFRDLSSMDQVHRIQGILIYFISLYVFYLILHKVLNVFQHHPTGGKVNTDLSANHPNGILKTLSPIFWYCTVTIGIPLLGRAYQEQGDVFFRHSVVVLSVCLLTFALFSIVRLSCQYLFYKISYGKNIGSKDGSS